jgi:carotenoid cleavage dioxygenase-like enzyme
LQLNVDTGKEIEYVFPDELFAQEPQFIPSPNPTSEDDGVLLVQGVDGTKNKGNGKLMVSHNKVLLMFQ